MQLTTDEALIRSIIEDESVIQGFNDGERMNDLSSCTFFYEEGVGLFPAMFKGNLISIHAAIPKKNRGIKAVRAAQGLARTLVDAGYELTARIRYNNKHLKRFVGMVGFSYQYDKGNYHYYRYM